MGNTSYNFSARTLRSEKLNYTSASLNSLFSQNIEKAIHETMLPSKALLRECRDSETHPVTIPIIFSLDVTGSMRTIPENLIREGLPKLMSKLIQDGQKDASLLFLAIGDHECDRAPLQVGQFESGDEELDLWLTRTWLEGRGGGNVGESYLLAWYYAAFHTSTDAFEKRGQKGYLFTVGDEPCLDTLPSNAIKQIMGTEKASTYTRQELLAKAQEKFHVFHFHISEDRENKSALKQWEGMLGQNCIDVKDYRKVPELLADTLNSHVKFNSAEVTNTTVENEINVIL